MGFRADGNAEARRGRARAGVSWERDFRLALDFRPRKPLPRTARSTQAGSGSASRGRARASTGAARGARVRGARRRRRACATQERVVPRREPGGLRVQSPPGGWVTLANAIEDFEFKVPRRLRRPRTSVELKEGDKRRRYPGAPRAKQACAAIRRRGRVRTSLPSSSRTSASSARAGVRHGAAAARTAAAYRDRRSGVRTRVASR